MLNDHGWLWFCKKKHITMNVGIDKAYLNTWSLDGDAWFLKLWKIFSIFPFLQRNKILLVLDGNRSYKYIWWWWLLTRKWDMFSLYNTIVISKPLKVTILALFNMDNIFQNNEHWSIRNLACYVHASNEFFLYKILWSRHQHFF